MNNEQSYPKKLFKYDYKSNSIIKGVLFVDDSRSNIYFSKNGDNLGCFDDALIDGKKYFLWSVATDNDNIPMWAEPA